MEVPNRRQFTVESESPVKRIYFDLERNPAEDDEHRSIGEGEGRVGESSGVERFSETKTSGSPRKSAVLNEKKTSPQRSFPSSGDSPIVSKRRLGRPNGRGKLQVVGSLGGFAWETTGGSFTAHALHIAEGEDIVHRLSTFSRQGPGAICIISAVGLVSTVFLYQPNSRLGAISRFEGTFEILRLSALFTGAGPGDEMSGKNDKREQISITVAKPDGRVFGGAVASPLIAASPTQIIVGSFKKKMSIAIENISQQTET